MCRYRWYRYLLNYISYAVHVFEFWGSRGFRVANSVEWMTQTFLHLLIWACLFQDLSKWDWHWDMILDHPLSRNHQWLWTTTFASHTSGGKRWCQWSLPCCFDCTMLELGHFGHLFARLMDCYFSPYIPTEAKTPSPDEINKLQSSSQEIAFLLTFSRSGSNLKVV